MEVIITGMVMPVTCAYCFFGMRIDNDNTACELKPFQIPNSDMEGRPDFCPLKYVYGICKKEDQHGL